MTILLLNLGAVLLTLHCIGGIDSYSSIAHSPHNRRGPHHRGTAVKIALKCDEVYCLRVIGKLSERIIPLSIPEIVATIESAAICM